MTYTLPSLPTNIDAAYPDRSPGDAAHQQHHDSIHAAFAGMNAAGGVGTGTPNILVLAAGAPIPAGTPSGSIILRRS